MIYDWISCLSLYLTNILIYWSRQEYSDELQLKTVPSEEEKKFKIAISISKNINIININLGGEGYQTIFFYKKFWFIEKIQSE